MIAYLRLKSPDKDLGKWEFLALPKEGDYLGVRLNDQPTAFRVEAVLHSPVQWPLNASEKAIVPSVTIMVSMSDGDLAGAQE